MCRYISRPESYPECSSYPLAAPTPSPAPLPYTTLFRSRYPGHAAPPSYLPVQRWCPTPELASPSPRCNCRWPLLRPSGSERSEDHTSELQSRFEIVCRFLLATTYTSHAPPNSTSSC